MVTSTLLLWCLFIVGVTATGGRHRFDDIDEDMSDLDIGELPDVEGQQVAERLPNMLSWPDHHDIWWYLRSADIRWYPEMERTRRKDKRPIAVAVRADAFRDDPAAWASIYADNMQIMYESALATFDKSCSAPDEASLAVEKNYLLDEIRTAHGFAHEVSDVAAREAAWQSQVQQWIERYRQTKDSGMHDLAAIACRIAKSFPLPESAAAGLDCGDGADHLLNHYALRYRVNLFDGPASTPY
jgi:hypothetical protein